MFTTTKPSKSNRQYLSREVWEKHVADYHVSGLTPPQYAKQYGLVLPTFRNWILRIKQRQRESQQTFVPVKVNNTATPSPIVDSSVAHDIHITLPNGIQCTFNAMHNPKQVLSWIDELRALA